MAQAILNMFPDAVSQFGLLGCGMFILGHVAIVGIMVALYQLHARESL